MKDVKVISDMSKILRHIWICLTTCIATAVYADQPTNDINKFIQSEMNIAKSPGLAYALVQKDNVTPFAYGLVRKGGDTNVTPDTPFPVGSISKSFTALAIIKLFESGDIELDVKISQYLEVFKDRPSGAITIRQLLSHTSGYSTLQGNDTQLERRQSKDALQRQVHRIAQWSLAHAPDTHWQYSNANYLILGALIEVVSGQDYASYINSEILGPIGMSHSFVSDGQAYAEMTHGHQPWFGGKRVKNSNVTDRVTAPAGGVISTATDLGLYLRMMLNGNDDIILADNKSLMFRPVSPTSPFYGLGWYVDTDNGRVSHSGLVPGVETLAVLSPKERKAVIVLINSNSGLGFGTNTQLFNTIRAKAFGDELPAFGRDWGVKSLFLLFLLLPIIFVIAILSLVFKRRRERLASKSGLSGNLSLWVPLPIMVILAWVCVKLIPELFGVSISTLSQYQPDFVILLSSTAISAVIWAILRLGVFYNNRA